MTEPNWKQKVLDSLSNIRRLRDDWLRICEDYDTPETFELMVEIQEELFHETMGLPLDYIQQKVEI